MMLAYGDGAYHEKMGLYGVAVLVAPSNEWSRLEMRWLKALHEFDPALYRVSHDRFSGRREALPRQRAKGP
jgi:hypothetical protein